jgi:tetratricopeptide (TPR) repeat protein
MQFPLHWIGASLQPEDFERFGPLFRQTVRQALSCETVCLEPVSAAGANNAERAEGQNRRAAQPTINPAGPFLSLPLWAGEQFLGFAVAGGGDPILYGGRSQEWLRERGILIGREMQLIKQWGTDPATGLPNTQAFMGRLQIQLAEPTAGPEAREGAGGQLMLLEVYPWVRNAEQGLLAIAKIASQLDSLIGSGSPLHHLGAGIFAQLRQSSPEEALKIGNGILRWLKRENVIRGHIGLTAVPADDTGLQAEREQRAAQVLEQAWQALRVARRRGPHALCTHAVLASRKEHSFNEIPPAVMNELRKRWRKVERFALLLLHQDQETILPDFLAVLSSSAGADGIILPLSEREHYIFLPDAGETEARQWIAGSKKLLAIVKSMTFSAGIALFPCADFKKTDLPANARKALLHTRFFGPDSATVFDSVSLNISGDVYYEEGDLARAVKEYRRGLVLAADNVNLLNSLGVACAQMNRYRSAIPLFEKALAIDPENFMALFNLGYAHLALTDTAKAIDCFARALARDGHHFEILLQLGKLYCQTGRFQEAVELLARAELLGTVDDNSAGRGRVYYYLGQADQGLGRHQRAIIHLQKAVQYNPRDAGAISLLGELYAREGQGEEIATALCRQAVELDDSQSDHWYRLGLVQWLRGEEKEAVTAVRQSLRLNRRNIAALRLLGDIFARQRRFALARQTHQRLLKLRPEGAQEPPGRPVEAKIHEDTRNRTPETKNFVALSGR